MNTDDLDRSYTELCNALARVGEARGMLLLGMTCLALMSRQQDCAEVLKIIAEAETQCAV